MDPDPEAWVALEQERLRRREAQLDQLDQMAELVAGLVLGRNEHARVIRELSATVGSHEEALAAARAGIEDVRRAVAHLAGRVNAVDVEKPGGVDDVTQGLVVSIDRRLQLIEHALPAIEQRIGLRRKAGKWTTDPGTLPG